MEQPQGRLLEGSGTGFRDPAASPEICAQAPEQTAMSQAKDLGEYPGEVEEMKSLHSAVGDPQEPRSPHSAVGDPQEPRSLHSAVGDPQEQRSPHSAVRDPQEPRFTPSADGDLECLICCHRYRCERPPKVLTCQHTFCAVCLKLLLTVRQDSWSVVCPLCRSVTSVPGGLICNLRDQVEILERLTRLGSEVQLSPRYLARPARGEVPGVGGEAGEDSESINRVAARRLTVHLLLLGLLIFLILPFVYPSIFGWLLVSFMCTALLLSSVFCCLPGGSDCCIPPKPLLPGQQKHSHVASIA